MIARHCFLLSDLENRVTGADEVVAYSAVTLEEARREHITIGLAVIERSVVSDGGLDGALQALGQHIVTGGILCLIGWTPAELPVMPPAMPWYGVDGRLWAPLVIEGTFLSWLCLGRMADSI